MTAAVGGFRAVCVDSSEASFGNEFAGIFGLVHVDGEVIFFFNTSKINTQELSNIALKICSKMGSEALFKGCFNGIAITEVYKIVNEET